jgi:nucleotide-binding universal stress UspA family protein
MKVLLAVDGSEYTKRMLGFVAAHDELLAPGTDFTVVTVVPQVPPRAASYFSKADLDDYYEHQAREVLDPVRTFAAQKGWNASFVHRVGPVAAEIAALATEGGHDLVVLGSHGHGALGGLVLGSVATGVLARCSTPALIVRK